MITQAAIISIGIGGFTLLFSVGMAWGIVKFGIKENSRRIGDLESSRSTMWEQVNKQGEGIASIDAKVDILVERKK